MPKLTPFVRNKQPAFDKSGIHYMGRSEKYRYGLAKEKRLYNLTEELGWNTADVIMAESLLGSCRFSSLCARVFDAKRLTWVSPTSFTDMPATFGLHRSMFINTLQSQTTDEQKKLFLEPALRFEIIGTFSPVYSTRTSWLLTSARTLHRMLRTD